MDGEKRMRIKYVDIPADGGSMVANATGVISETYGGEGINGRVHKVWYDSSSAGSATGSIWLLVSGTGEQIWFAKGDVNADIIDYPRVPIVDNTSTAVPGASGAWTEYVCRDLPLKVLGSAMGNAKVVNKIRVYYY